ncbi:S-adenosyl-L-methionine-dependent methyltransferase [Fistulina hepatica ATCC 64428]|nr:S-adenosyl-L-methionine-dependent methyltransferase [Fistulina hepatica ATCC 64428]
MKSPRDNANASEDPFADEDDDGENFIFEAIADDELANARFFRVLHDFTLNNVNKTYMLPADEDEKRRSEIHHKLIQFLFNGKNYVGPVQEVLQKGEQRRALDVGTGCGSWVIDLADEFPHVKVFGADLAPIQPRVVPPNCLFEIVDFDSPNLPYSDNYFDLIHGRYIHTGIRDYPRFVHSLARMLRPGGLLILIEPELTPIVNGRPVYGHARQGRSRPYSVAHDLSGWVQLWEAYTRCLRLLGVHPSVPQHMADVLSESMLFDRVWKQDGNIPVGFWPTDPHSLTVGQLQWMDYELLLPGLRPILVEVGRYSDVEARTLILNAQENLYRSEHPLSTRIHIVYAIKR